MAARLPRWARGRLNKRSGSWILHGINVEFIRPGCQQGNGSHEWKHETLKAECCNAAPANMRAQPKCFSIWREEFDTMRTQETPGIRVPGDVYRVSNERAAERIKARACEPDDKILNVSASESIHLDYRSLPVDDALRNVPVAVDRDPTNGLIAVRFAHMKLGEYKMDQKKSHLMYPGFREEKRRLRKWGRHPPKKKRHGFRPRLARISHTTSSRDEATNRPRSRSESKRRCGAGRRREAKSTGTERSEVKRREAIRRVARRVPRASARGPNSPPSGSRRAVPAELYESILSKGNSTRNEAGVGRSKLQRKRYETWRETVPAA